MSKNIIMSVNTIKARRSLKNIEEDKARKFTGIVTRAYQPNPDPKDLEELQKWLDEYPEIWRLVFDMSQVLETNLIKRMLPQQAAHLALEMNVQEIRHDLGYEEATVLETMLIDSIVMAWLRCQFAEYRYLLHMDQADLSTPEIAFCEQRLSAAHGRYLRACETLAKIRKLSLKNSTLQLNIATKSGQQVNVAGDVIKK